VLGTEIARAPAQEAPTPSSTPTAGTNCAETLLGNPLSYRLDRVLGAVDDPAAELEQPDGDYV
jgi:hypothetical protein